MPTGAQITQRALQAAGILASGETADAVMAQDALAILQRMINAWGIDRGVIAEILRTVKGLTSGTRDYTIGPGGSINIAYPDWIDSAGLILDSTVTDPYEHPLHVYNDQEWQAVRLKTLDARIVTGIYFDHAFSSTGRGTISTYPTINIANVQIVLYTPLAMTGFLNLATNYLLRPGYEDALHYNLAKRICVDFEHAISGDLRQLADDSLALIKRANTRPVALDVSGVPSARGGRATKAYLTGDY